MKDTLKSSVYNFFRFALVLISIVYLTACASDAHESYSSAQEWKIDENFSVIHTIRDSTVEIQFHLKNDKSGWMSIAFHHELFPADTIVAWYDKSTDTAVCWDAFNPSIPSFVSFPSPIQDIDPLLSWEGREVEHNQNNVRQVSWSIENGTTTITCERDLLTRDPYDFQIRRGHTLNVTAAYNEDTGFIDALNSPQAAPDNFGKAVWEIR